MWIPGRPRTSGISPKDREPPRWHSYPAADSSAASSHSPSAPFRCDLLLIAFLENNLQADGSVLIPKVLQPYMGGKTVLTPKK